MDLYRRGDFVSEDEQGQLRAGGDADDDQYHVARRRHEDATQAKLLCPRPPPLAEVSEGTRRRTRGLGEGPQPDGLRAVCRRRPAHPCRGDPRSRASTAAHGQAGRDPRLARCPLVGHVRLQGNGGSLP
jgi:hypothetical protein